MQFSAEIWRRSDNIQALGDFSQLIGEKSPILGVPTHHGGGGGGGRKAEGLSPPPAMPGRPVHQGIRGAWC